MIGRCTKPFSVDDRLSVWTQSTWGGLWLVCLQCKMGVQVRNFLMTSTSIGVDHSYKEIGFYSKGFDEDELRVNELIKNAPEVPS